MNILLWLVLLGLDVCTDVEVNELDKSSSSINGYNVFLNGKYAGEFKGEVYDLGANEIYLNYTPIEDDIFKNGFENE